MKFIYACDIHGDEYKYEKLLAEAVKQKIKYLVFGGDLFHLEKYTNHLNYNEYLKNKLQEAINQNNPVSTENIMKEAIKEKNNK